MIGMSLGRVLPHLPIEACRHRRGGLRIARAFATRRVMGAVGGHLHGVQFPEVTVASQFAGIAKIAVGPLPSAGLEDALVLADGIANRLFVLTALTTRWPGES